jgi:hypothetical protein
LEWLLLQQQQQLLLLLLLGTGCVRRGHRLMGLLVRRHIEVARRFGAASM